MRDEIPGLKAARVIGYVFGWCLVALIGLGILSLGVWLIKALAGML